ncbi:hypothetical protein RA280_27065 [Cupriavidus sp. CV2]|nr:hypothetical protein [Cupriavidus sp. CV2]
MTAMLATFARVLAIAGSMGARAARECHIHSVYNHLFSAARLESEPSAAGYPAHRGGMPASATELKVGHGR